MSSAGTIAGLSPWALLGVKGVGLGRRGGVPGAAPFMAAGAATASRASAVKTSTSLAGVLVAAGRQESLPLATGAVAFAKPLFRVLLGLLDGSIGRQRSRLERAC